MPGGIPICVYEAELGKFRVTRAKGKALSSGGYGVTWHRTTTTETTGTREGSAEATASVVPSLSTADRDPSTDEKKSADSHGGGTAETVAVTTAAEYLFIEEVLFLHERGLIQALRQTGSDMKTSLATADNGDGITSSDTDPQQDPVLDTRALYEIMLYQLQMPLMVYLTYSHLRSQTFIVLRHTVNRHSLLEKLQSTMGATNQNHSPPKKKMKNQNNAASPRQNSVVGSEKIEKDTTKARSNENINADDADGGGDGCGDATTDRADEGDSKDNKDNKDDKDDKNNKDRESTNIAFIKADGGGDGCGDATTDRADEGDNKDDKDDKDDKDNKDKDRTNSAPTNEEKINHKDATNKDEKKRKSVSTTDTPKGLKRQLRQDIFEAPIPPIIRSTCTTETSIATTENTTDACKTEDGTVPMTDNTALEKGRQHATATNDSIPSPIRPNNHDNTSTDHDNTSTANTQKDYDGIAFDVYNPNSQFRKTNPGLPDYYVAVTAYDEPSPPFPELLHLIKACRGIPLRMATVADGGTVIMFGLTDFGAPSIA